MFIWVKMPSDIDAKKLLELEVKEGAAFVPGEFFFAKDAPKTMPG